MEVPDRMLNMFPATGDHAARIFSPGAVISGYIANNSITVRTKRHFTTIIERILTSLRVTRSNFYFRADTSSTNSRYSPTKK